MSRLAGPLLTRIARAALLSALGLHASASAGGADERRSGYEFMSAATRAMQDDDVANPGTLWVLDGEALWSARPGEAGAACAGCHGDASGSMRGVAARYPAFDEGLARPVSLEQRINLCRARHQKAPAFAYESRELLALTAFVANQSRGMAIDIAADGRIDPFLRRGRETFYRRVGQLDIACAQCHEQYWGRRLGGSTIPQAHPTGYPLYRLEWQGLGSLQRRLRNCLAGVRAEPWPYGAPELVDLELFLMWRARGMRLETPAVRP